MKSEWTQAYLATKQDDIRIEGTTLWRRLEHLARPGRRSRISRPSSRC